jgi:pimeloyl-ACP methyl ester carboxylesterase
MPYASNALDASRVYFEDDGGDGTPIVFLGGFLDTVDLARGSPLAQALHELPKEFRLVYVDHRGHGRSDKPHDAGAYAMRLRVADTVAVLDELGIERAHFVGISWGGRLAFGVGEHAQEHARSLVIVGQQPYAIDPDGPLTRMVGEALKASREQGIEALVLAFETHVGRYPKPARDIYLASDAAAMRAAWSSAIAEGPISENLGAWVMRCLICVATGDGDFFDQAKRAAEEIPNAEFVSIEGTDHLGMDTAKVDPMLPAVLRTLREPS